MAGRRTKRSPKKHTNKKAKKQQVRGVFSLLGKIAYERGKASEHHVRTMLRELLEAGEIADVIEVARHTWADFVLHTDVVVRRLDGMLVPIQVKSSLSGIKEFIEKHTHSCLNKFGALPVLVEAKPYGFDDWESAKRTIAHEVNRWQGYFALAIWMLIPTPLFNLGQCSYFGKDIRARINAFRRQHPEYFQEK